MQHEHTYFFLDTNAKGTLQAKQTWHKSQAAVTRHREKIYIQKRGFFLRAQENRKRAYTYRM
jgi:hypothetical protein